jgi:chloride channel 3/4/5
MSTPDPTTYSAPDLRQPVVRRISTNATAPLASEVAEDFRNVIGNEDGTTSPTENTRLHQSASSRSYGTLPEARRRLFAKTSAVRRNLSQLSLRADAPPRTRSNSLLVQSPASFRDISFSRLSTRPISTYDDPVGSKDEIPDADTKINGIRVWYSSFTSIDWLHDAIKDAARFSRLRKRKSLRSRLRLVFDKSLGWIIVTIVGFITAFVAFFVVRSEQLLFDLKEGHCTTSWWKAKRFCCPNATQLAYQYTSYLEPENCVAWRTWSEFSTGSRKENNHAVEFISYAIIAVCSVVYS